MSSEIDITQGSRDHLLEESIENATTIITKNYLDKLETYEIIKPSEEDMDINIKECSQFYKLTKLVLNREENFLDKLTTIVNVVSSIECSLATIIKSNGSDIEYYIGIISKNSRLNNKNNRRKRSADIKAFKGAISGNLQGSELEEVSSSELERFHKDVLEDEGNCYSAVSGIVSLRDQEDKSIQGYVQGIENLVDSLKSSKYTIVMLADPVGSSEIQVIKQGYEMLHTQLSTFLRNSITINENDTLSLSRSRTEGITEGISKGIAMTQSTTKSKGKYSGVNASIGMNIGVTVNTGIATGINSGTANTDGKTYTSMEMKQENKAVTNTTASSKTSGRSLQINYENRSVRSLLDKIDLNLERLDQCESFGAFDCAAYVIAETREEALTVASNYNALMRGKGSSVQASHINTWYKEKDTKMIGKYVGSFVHPRLCRKNDVSNAEKIIVTPASMVSGNEIAIQIGLPKKSINGVTVIPMAPFGRNVIGDDRNGILLGNLYHMGHEEGEYSNKQKVRIDIESLCMHTFITGSTGTGKSTTIYSLLEKLMVHPIKGQPKEYIKFMVVEPTKGEYKDRFSKYNNVAVFGTNSKKTPLLRINPFSFPDDIHVLEHIDRLIEIFNVCWPMYAAMPAVLKDSIERAYIVAGWNLDTSECKYKNSIGKCLYPSFIDVLHQIQVVMEESQYSQDSKGDYKGALCTRLKSLTNGLYGQIFSSNELSAEELFDNNVIIDLSRTGSSETKSLIMGLLVMKLQEYRMSNRAGSNSNLRHVTVLEEAHNLLKKTQNEQGMETANIQGKSVEMLANSIAEMRTYGEGFIIADQAPGLMDTSVIRNTNTKIILRLPDYLDRELVGRSANLNDEQIMELSRLKTFVAAVYQNNWLEPVLCNMDIKFETQTLYKYKPKDSSVDTRKQCIEYLIMPLSKRKLLSATYIDSLKDSILSMDIPAYIKVLFLKYMKATTKEEIQSLRGKIGYHLFNSENVFTLCKSTEHDIDLWYKQIQELLQPSLTQFTETEQKKIIAMITKEKAVIDNTDESVTLFENLMSYL